jgi:hypothetical protein
VTSDSLKATVIVIELVSTISAKPEPLESLDDELEPPRLPDELDPLEPVDPDPEPDPLEPVEPDPEPLDPLDPDELELDELAAETVSPGLVLCSETIVPLAGAYSRVSASVSCALLRLS